ncbi:hypothetical protein GCM10010121_088070 [Streptomyces brasiliensis]|uniref:Uncharacterized protein n=1 Tax=Streptomyces brasiliensis TaxID=1954 RepID=A0A917P6E4_9ACTN|nr:hypothetical protein GCM10010121_088070 [Streptomyces brasiliensis]
MGRELDRLPFMNTAVTSGGTAEPVILGGKELTSDPNLKARFVDSAHQILADLVREGAALGWVVPPSGAISRFRDSGVRDSGALVCCRWSVAVSVCGVTVLR